MYFFFIGTWRLNILKIVLLYIPKSSTLEVAVTISYLNLHYRNFYDISRQLPLVLVSEIPFWIHLLSKDRSLRDLFQKYCCVGIGWNIYIKISYEYEVIIGFTMFVNDTVQAVKVTWN